MPTEKDHRALAAHNQEAIEHLLLAGDGFPDWVTTVAFYKALHVFEALLYRDYQLHGISHDQRSRILFKEPRYRQIARHYSVLKEASSIARYLCDTGGRRSYKTFSDYLTMETVKSEILSRLKNLEQAAAALKPPPKK